MPSNLRHDHPQVSNLTRWHLHAKLRTWPVFPEDIPDVRKRTSYVKSLL